MLTTVQPAPATAPKTPVSPKREALRHAEAAQQAAEYFRLLARGDALPFTPVDFDVRVKEFFERMNVNLQASNALAIGALRDEPCPVALFEPWAGYKTIRRWSLVKGPDRLETELLNGKRCVRPSLFFKAFKSLGKAAP